METVSIAPKNIDFSFYETFKKECKGWASNPLDALTAKKALMTCLLVKDRILFFKKGLGLYKIRLENASKKRFADVRLKSNESTDPKREAAAKQDIIYNKLINYLAEAEVTYNYIIDIAAEIEKYYYMFYAEYKSENNTTWENATTIHTVQP